MEAPLGGLSETSFRGSPEGQKASPAGKTRESSSSSKKIAGKSHPWTNTMRAEIVAYMTYSEGPENPENVLQIFYITYSGILKWAFS